MKVIFEMGETLKEKVSFSVGYGISPLLRVGPLMFPFDAIDAGRLVNILDGTIFGKNERYMFLNGGVPKNYRVILDKEELPHHVPLRQRSEYRGLSLAIREDTKNSHLEHTVLISLAQIQALKEEISLYFGFV